MEKKFSAFTLMEILTAMVIFVLVGTFVIPSIMKSSEKSLFSTQLKKVNNDIQQAMLVILAKNHSDYTTVCSADAAGAASNKCFRDELVKYLEPIVTYDNENDVVGANAEKYEDYYGSEYFNKREFLNKTGFDYEADIVGISQDTMAAAVLKNGASVNVVYNHLCNADMSDYLASANNSLPVCGIIEVDLNAQKGPNTIGKDIHYFWIVNKEGIIPFGEVDGLDCGVINNEGEYTTLPTKRGLDKVNLFGCTYRVFEDGKITYF
ncbi:MAG: type II secretion system protein [Candidatus Gastranaerophilales bacterium]|nr:type II secretion system protein [Candidatus Gastranaerophilales bacterium]